MITVNAPRKTNASPESDGAPDRRQEALARLDEAFAGFFAWLGGQFAPEEGGFYYQRSSRETPGEFGPDLESTGQGVAVLHRCGLLRQLSQKHRDAIVGFIRRHQHPDGYFRSTGGTTHNPERMLGRYLNYCRLTLDWLGAEPPHPYPRTFGDDPSNHELQPRELAAWLNALPWDNAWMALDWVSARVQILDAMPVEVAGEAIEFLLDQLEARQEAATGLWGGGVPYVRVSGAFKASIAFKNHRPFPRADAVYASLLSCVSEHRADRLTWMSNPLNLFSALEPHLTREPSREERDRLLGLISNDLWTCLRDDGGFSVEAAGSWAAPNTGIVLGHGRVEGDMNSATLATQVRANLRGLVGLEPGCPPNAGDLFDAIPKPSSS